MDYIIADNIIRLARAKVNECKLKLPSLEGMEKDYWKEEMENAHAIINYIYAQGIREQDEMN